MAAIRTTTDRAEIERIWETIQGRDYDSMGMIPEREDEDAEGVEYAVETLASRGRETFTLHYALPVDEYGDVAEPAPEHVYEVQVEENFTIRIAGDDVIVECTDGQRWEIESTAEEGLWEAIDRYDREHGTMLYASIDERRYLFVGE